MQTNDHTHEQGCKKTHENTCVNSCTVVTMLDWKALYLQVFSKEAYQELPKPRPGANYEVKFKNDPGYLCSKIYPLTWKEQQALQKWLEENVANGCLEPGESDYVSPVFFKDKGDKLRPIINYKKLNSVRLLSHDLL